MSCKTSICNCGEFSGPLLGRPNCIEKVGYTRRLAFMPILDSSGARNFINFDDGTGNLDTIDATFIAALLQASPDKRLYLTPLVEDVEFSPQEADYEDFKSGRSIKLKDNGTEITALLVDDDANFTALREMKSLECGEWGFFEIDNNGSLIGDASEWDQLRLYPIPLQKMSVAFNRKTADGSQKITVTFAVSDIYFEGNTNFITCSAMDVDLVTLPPIERVTMSIVGSSTTTLITVKVNSNYIVNLQAAPVVGLAVANFIVLKQDGVTDQSPASLVENPDGTYALTGTYATGENAIVQLDYAGHLANDVITAIP